MMQNRHGKKVVGITGGSGCGKSYISDLLRERGYTVIDADKTGHDCINLEKCRKELTDYFGAEIESGDKIDRKKLGMIVFSDREKLNKLNEIVLKYILESIERQIENAESEIVFADGATMIESGMPCDKMIGVLADRDIRLERITKRDGITEDYAMKRISSQPDDDFYKEHCDIIITNNGGEINIDELIKGL